MQEAEESGRLGCDAMRCNAMQVGPAVSLGNQIADCWRLTADGDGDLD